MKVSREGERDVGQMSLADVLRPREREPLTPAGAETARPAGDRPPAGPLLLHRSENPWGTSPRAVEAVRAELTGVHRYPDPRHTDLVAALAAHHGVTTDRVAVGNGVDEVVLLLALALRDVGRAVINEATFQGYPKSLEAVGLDVVGVPLDHHRVGPAALIEEMNRGPALVFVCNPHNPTGSVLAADDLRLLCEKARDTGSHLVVDEAYAEFTDDTFASALPWAREGGAVSVLRTFSKAYGLAALRVGALIGDPGVVSRMEIVQDAMPFHVNRLAQVAACAALEDHVFLEQTRVRTAAVRASLCRRLDRLGITYLPSQANFVTLHLPGIAAEVARRLLTDQIHVRDTADMGMPGWLRISVGTPADVRILVRSLEAAVTAITGQEAPR